MPHPYALQVLSRPLHISEQLWTQWYTEEHIRDLVYSGSSKTSAVYRASSSDVVSANTDGDSHEAPGASATFLALYQTNSKESVLKTCNAEGLRCKVRTHSTLFDGKSCYDQGHFQPLDLQLVEILGSYETREDVAPYLLHHVISGEDIEGKIQFDHVNAVANGLEGYRRTLLYRPLEPKRYEWAKDLGAFVVLVHEFDGAVDAGRLPGVSDVLKEIAPTRGCQFWLRPWKLIESEGFEGKESRVPERMET